MISQPPTPPCSRRRVSGDHRRSHSVGDENSVMIAAGKALLQQVTTGPPNRQGILRHNSGNHLGAPPSWSLAPARTAAATSALSFESWMLREDDPSVPLPPRVVPHIRDSSSGLDSERTDRRSKDEHSTKTIHDHDRHGHHDDDNLSVAMDQILQYLDHFTFSSGKKMPLSPREEAPISTITLRSTKDNFDHGLPNEQEEMEQDPPLHSPPPPRDDDTFSCAQSSTSNDAPTQPAQMSDPASRSEVLNDATQSRAESSRVPHDVVDNTIAVQQLWQQAHEERQWVRTWARNVRDTCRHWVQQQRQLVRQQQEILDGERQAFDEKRQAWIAEEPPQAPALPPPPQPEPPSSSEVHHEIIRYQETVSQLQQACVALRRELTHAWKQHHEVEQELRNTIAQQQEQLEILLLLSNLPTTTVSMESKWEHDSRPTNHVASELPPMRTQATATTANTPRSPSWAKVSDTCAPTPYPRSPPTVSPEQMPPYRAGTADRSHPTTLFRGAAPRTRRREVHHADDGSTVTKYGNGAVKTVYPDGQLTIQYQNGDQLRYLFDAHRYEGANDRENEGSNHAIFKQEYYFSVNRITQICRPDHVFVEYHFPNGQVERHYPDGKKFIRFPDGNETWVVFPEAAPPPTKKSTVKPMNGATFSKRVNVSHLPHAVSQSNTSSPFSFSESLDGSVDRYEVANVDN